MRAIYAFLIFGLALLAIGHLTAERINFSLYPFTLFHQNTHTEASVWVRVCSIPLRLGLVVALLRRLRTTDCRLTMDENSNQLLLRLWGLLAIYYAFDILFNSGLSLSTAPLVYMLFSGLAASLMLIIWPGRMVIAGSVLFVLLAILIHIAESAGNTNNAFTLFGMDGIALIWIGLRTRWTNRCLQFIYLLPTFGYVFPLAEKLLLNPIGWMSGKTLYGYGALYGYQMPQVGAAILSWGLLVFQGSFAAVWVRPGLGRWLYPLAICFHLLAGLVLEFGAVLNPWIVSLGVAWAVGESAHLKIASRK